METSIIAGATMFLISWSLLIFEFITAPFEKV